MAGDCECILCGKRKAAPLVHRKRTPYSAVDSSNIIAPRPMVPRPARNIAKEESDGSTRDSSATGIATGRARRDPKQSGAPYAIDGEGTEDVYKKFLQRLENAKDSTRGIDFDIEEENSLDWRAEHEYNGLGQDSLLASLTQVEQQHSFIPRIGELVLWCPNFLDGHYLMLNNKTYQYMYYSFEQEAWHGFPEWRAGVVSAVPSRTTDNGPIDFTDILDAPSKNTSINTAGFRVETLPDPNDPLNKSTSKQYKYVPLRNIRPLSHWQSLLRITPEKNMHPSIKYAFTCMSSISLVEKFKAVGQWNSGKIMCRGVYLGAELITIGDTIRLAPVRVSRLCNEVMIVDSIRLNLEEVRSEHVSPASPYLCSRSSITFVGSAYILDSPAEDEIDDDVQIARSAVPLEQVKTLFRPVGSAEYGSWYQLHDPRKRLEVSHDQVLGRLYEADAVRLWTCQLQHKSKEGDRLTHKPPMGFDAPAISSARRYATHTDGRIPEPTGRGNLWYWADTRAEALAIETFNGIEVGRYDSVRTRETLRHWNAQMQVLNGKPITTETSKYISFAKLPGLFGDRRGRKAGSRLVNGKVVYPGDPAYPIDGQQTGEETQQDSPQRPMSFSAMAGAAFASTDEEGSDGVDDDLEVVDVAGRDGGEDVLQQFIRKSSPKKKPPEPRKQLTKVDIMESVEGGDDYDSAEEAWLHEPIPPARGGTEESEGGDYDPQRSQKTKLTAFGSMGRTPRRYDDNDSE